MKENTALSPEAQAVLSASHTDPQVVADILRAIASQSVFADVAVNKTIEVVPVAALLATADELEAL